MTACCISPNYRTWRTRSLTGERIVAHPFYIQHPYGQGHFFATLAQSALNRSNTEVGEGMFGHLHHDFVWDSSDIRTGLGSLDNMERMADAGRDDLGGNVVDG